MGKDKLKVILGGGVLCLLLMFYLNYAHSAVQTFGLSTASKVIVIDPGHGGFDPGKVGITGVLEKEINLKIAKKLQNYLEQSGAYVTMTRTEDVDLDGNDNKQLKKKDMHNRKEKVNNSEADILISIHQNAFTQEKVRGAQVFYHGKSESGKALAQSIQKTLKAYADPDNKRVPKHNDDYYVIRTTKMPAVIVECGFLTNREEEAKLNTDEYQEQISWAIYLGIIDYFQNQAEAKPN